MPKQVKDIKEIMKLLKAGSVRAVRVKKNADNTKFKVRCSKYLYTYVCKDEKKAEDIKKAIPSEILTVEIANRKPKAQH